LNRKVLADQADVSLELVSPGSPQWTNALISHTDILPRGEIVLGNITALARDGGKVQFGDESGRGKVEFSGGADSAFGIGVYVDAADAIKAIAPSPELVEGLKLADRDATRYVLLRAEYDLKGSARGAVALGAGAVATFGGTSEGRGLFAVLHRFHDSEKAQQVFEDTFRSWSLPFQVTEANDLAPGTWLVAEVSGSIAFIAGLHAGYDFSWIREIPGGALRGDIGLRVQLGANATVGFEASGNFALVLGRETDAQSVRLRLFKMAKNGWNFALEARAGFESKLPPFFDPKKKAEDLVSAIFGLNENQIFEVFKETRAFVNSTTSLQDKLAGVIMDLGGNGIENPTGLSQEAIGKIYEEGRQKLIAYVQTFETLVENGGHELTSMLLSLDHFEINGLQVILKTIAETDGEAHLRDVFTGVLSEAGFERTPIGRFLEAGIGPLIGVLNNIELAQKAKGLASCALTLMEGATLQQLLDFVREKVHVDRVLEVVNQTDFDKLDNLLKNRVAEFLGKQNVLMDDLANIQNAMRSVLAHVDEFYDVALNSAKKEQEFSFAGTYARNTMKTALLDISFDLSKPGVSALLSKAVDGDFGGLLLNAEDGVTLHTAEFTHNLRRNISSDLTMPFGAITFASMTNSTAKLQVAEDGGRVLVYSLNATDEAAERKSLFGARSGRDSALTVAASMPSSPTQEVHVWKDSPFRYFYRMERAVAKMRATQLRQEIQPLLDRYMPSVFTNASSLSEWVTNLDKLLDGKDPNSGSEYIGDTLFTLDLAAPPAYLKAWTKSPMHRKDKLYCKLSRALQAKLKELVSFYFFSDPARYKDIASAAAPIVYACLPVSTSIQLNRGGGVQKFNTDSDVYWDYRDVGRIRAMARDPHTVQALSRRMESIATLLKSIPGFADTVKMYAPSEINDTIETALKPRFAGSSLPEQLVSLLTLESSLVRNAAKTGVEMARFRESAQTKPGKALEHLAKFGGDLANAFQHAFGSHPHMNGASRPLATLLFMEAARVFDDALDGSGVAARVRTTVIQSDKLSIDQMLTGKITPDIILHDQVFVQG